MFFNICSVFTRSLSNIVSSRGLYCSSVNLHYIEIKKEEEKLHLLQEPKDCHKICRHDQLSLALWGTCCHLFCSPVPELSILPQSHNLKSELNYSFRKVKNSIYSNQEGVSLLLCAFWSTDTMIHSASSLTTVIAPSSPNSTPTHSLISCSISGRKRSWRSLTTSSLSCPSTYTPFFSSLTYIAATSKRRQKLH